MSDDGLPVGLWVDAKCAALNAAGQGYYIAHRGDYSTGVVMVKVYDTGQRSCALYIQQRDFDGNMGWADAIEGAPLAERDVDSYIQRALSYDPDMWVIEIEAHNTHNPFEG